MLDTLRIIAGSAVAVLIYQLIRFGPTGIDWLGPVVVGVLTVIIYSLLGKIHHSEDSPFDKH